MLEHIHLPDERIFNCRKIKRGHGLIDATLAAKARKDCRCGVSATCTDALTRELSRTLFLFEAGDCEVLINKLLRDPDSSHIQRPIWPTS